MSLTLHRPQILFSISESACFRNAQKETEFLSQKTSVLKTRKARFLRGTGSQSQRGRAWQVWYGDLKG